MRSVTAIRTAGLDRWGDPAEGRERRWTVEGVELAPQSRPEDVEPGRSATEHAWTLYARGSASLGLTEGDFIEVDDAVYVVDGAPQVWSGSPGGTSVALKRVAG